MGSSVDIFCVFCLWNTFLQSKWAYQPHPQEIVDFLGIFFGLSYAAFCFASFLRWYL